MAVAVAAWGASASADAVVTLRVTPRSGTARSRFSVHFLAVTPSGMTDGSFHAYALSATAPAHARGCLRSISLDVTATVAEEAMTVTFNPSKLGGHWCTGTYSGLVTETVRPGCGPIVAQERRSIACPEFVLLEPVGSFRFTVKG